MALKAGTLGAGPGAYADSMAEAMEEAFKIEWQKVKPGIRYPGVGDDMQLLFTAIAQGVVRHLVERVPQAFELSVVTTQVMGTGPTGATGSPITADNPSEIHLTGGGGGAAHIDPHQAVVEQRQTSKVVSDGYPTVTKVKYDGTLHML